MAVKPVTLLTLAGGIVVLWSGVTDRSPVTVIKDLLSGAKPNQAPTSVHSINTATVSGDNQSSDNSKSSAGGNTGASTAIAKKNQAIAAPMASLYGWGPGTSNWESLLKLWTRESGWNNRAENSSSGAYGIAQALGHGPTNQYPAGPANPPISSATAQIAWGLQYIKDTYGNPNGAWAHEESAGWY